jgi:hypothetical protein
MLDLVLSATPLAAVRGEVARRGSVGRVRGEAFTLTRLAPHPEQARLPASRLGYRLAPQHEVAGASKDARHPLPQAGEEVWREARP